MSFKMNPLHAIDFYKSGHIKFYDKGTTEIYSNFTPRNLSYLNVVRNLFDNKVVFFGLQAFIKRFLVDSFNEEFFQQPLEKVLKVYKNRMDTSLFTDFDVSHIEALHKLGYLPIRIKALPEGVKVRAGIPVFTIVNTHPEFFWLTNYIETVISSEVWKKMVNATIANHYRKIFEKYALITGVSLDFVDWQGHDFSFRGMSGWDDATMTGMAHLTSFLGTDSVSSIDAIEYYYPNSDKVLIGGSVPASEHSCSSVNGIEGEVDFYKRVITESYPSGIVSIVSDTYDFFNVLDVIAPSLMNEILNRNGKVVFRPDSGDPVEIICGKIIHKYDNTFDVNFAAEDVKEYVLDNIQDETQHGQPGPSEVVGYFELDGRYYKVIISILRDRYDKQFYYIERYDSVVTSIEEFEPSPEILGAVRVLDKHFGHTLTEKGYKTLDKHVGLIYGDSITPARANEILNRLEKMGYSSDNCVFGIGSYTYNFSTRDSIGAALKSTSAVVNGIRKEIFKDPKTDSGIKKSAKGLLRVELENDEYVLYDQQTEEQEKQGCLAVVYENGEIFNINSLSTIRKTLTNF